MPDYASELINNCLNILKNAYESSVSAINFSDKSDSFWYIIDLIKADRSRALAIAKEYVHLDNPVSRLFGIYLYGEIFNPTEDEDHKDAMEMINTLSAISTSEHDVSCLIAIADAIGNPYLHEAEKTLIALSKHNDAEVRFAATRSLGSTSIEVLTSEWIIQMILLAQDEDDDIRDWATMHLAGVEENDSRVSEALVRQLDDDNIEVRTEAIHGLANKGDVRGLPALKSILEQGPADRKDLESAGLYGLPELLPLLDGFNTKDHLLDWVQKRCSSELTIKDSVDDEWLGDDTYVMVQQGKRRPIKYKEWGGIGSPWNN